MPFFTSGILHNRIVLILGEDKENKRRLGDGRNISLDKVRGKSAMTGLGMFVEILDETARELSRVYSDRHWLTRLGKSLPTSVCFVKRSENSVAMGNPTIWTQKQHTSQCAKGVVLIRERGRAK